MGTKGQTINRCVIIAGGEITDRDQLFGHINPDDFIICADSGYAYAVLSGIKPDLVLGDFDSYTGELPQDVEIITLPVHKDDTDLIFAARQVIERGFKEVLLLGVLGGRADHTMAAYSCLLFLEQNGVKTHILTETEDISMILSSKMEIARPEYDCYLSVIPFGGPAEGVTLQGLCYPLNNYYMDPSFPIGVSNTFLADTATVSVKKGNVMIMLVRK